MNRDYVFPPSTPKKLIKINFITGSKQELQHNAIDNESESPKVKKRTH